MREFPDNNRINQMEQERPYSNVIRRLRDVGLRPTRQRIALAQLLFQDGDRHVTAEALKKDAARDGVQVSLATIYNTLNQFVEVGLLREVIVESERSYFDTNTSPHHHFFVQETGQLIDVPVEDVTLVKLPEAPAGQAITGVDIVIKTKSLEN